LWAKNTTAENTMANDTYGPEGTIFYNPVLASNALTANTHPFVRALHDVFGAPAGASGRDLKQWQAHVRMARALGRAGAVHALAVRPGRIAARVIDPASKTTISVRIEGPIAAAQHWADIALRAARDASLAAELANSERPQPWMDALLLSNAELTVATDDARYASDAPLPLLVAAVWPVFVDRVREDPWLWVLFRGQTRLGLLDQSRKARAAQHALDQHASTGLHLASFWQFESPVANEPPPGGEPYLMTMLKQRPGDLRLGRRRLSSVIKRGLTPRRA
jgi:hypothetical protein